MQTVFVQIKCDLQKTTQVAECLVDSGVAQEIYSTAGEFDLIIKIHTENEVDISTFIENKLQSISGIRDTMTTIAYKAFK